MPELPEVETVVSDLRPLISGRRIGSVLVYWPRTIDAKSIDLKALEGEAVARVWRVGKYIAIVLASGRTLAIHLRMTGRLHVVADGEPVGKHERLSLTFAGGMRLAFVDARKFGRVRLFEGDAEQTLGVAPDPLDSRMGAAGFATVLEGRTASIKSVLLDQSKISGIGNIYACEALYRARINPSRRADTLNAEQRSKLLRALRVILKSAIASRGSSVVDYVDAHGERGWFQVKLAVYGRAGKPCRRCRTPIQRIVQAARSTFFCPKCQPRRRAGAVGKPAPRA